MENKKWKQEQEKMKGRLQGLPCVAARKHDPLIAENRECEKLENCGVLTIACFLLPIAY
jgi:hypothetical protein